MALNIIHHEVARSQERRTVFVPDSASRLSATRNEHATEQRSGAIAWLVLAIIAVVGWLCGGFIGAVAFVACTVALCMLANLWDEAKEMAKEGGKEGGAVK